jgi:hypothetical protein
LFTGINFSYSGKYISYSIEPFYLKSQNQQMNILERGGIFSYLNDASHYKESPYTSIGLRETQLYLHYNSFGFGFSNANMWWGPGIHNTLTMTNNTTGFPHLMIGTINEKRVRNVGLNFRYVFSKLDKTYGDPYFTAMVWSLRYYSDPIITIGFSRNYLSGGLPTDRPFTSMDAALIIFEQLLIDTKIREYPPDWDEHDPWDQLMSGNFVFDNGKSNIK